MAGSEQITSHTNNGQAIHQELMDLWERYKNLQMQILTLQGSAADLATEISDCGKRIYELYHISDNGLEGKENSS